MKRILVDVHLVSGSVIGCHLKGNAAALETFDLEDDRVEEALQTMLMMDVITLRREDGRLTVIPTRRIEWIDVSVEEGVP